jgi:hypothetical protein
VARRVLFRVCNAFDDPKVFEEFRKGRFEGGGNLSPLLRGLCDTFCEKVSEKSISRPVPVKKVNSRKREAFLRRGFVFLRYFLAGESNQRPRRRGQVVSPLLRFSPLLCQKNFRRSTGSVLGHAIDLQLSSDMVQYNISII